VCRYNSLKTFSSVTFHNHRYGVSTAGTHIETEKDTQRERAILLDVRNNINWHKKRKQNARGMNFFKKKSNRIQK
jgi:hypothetical protein